jgi:hypothetical protein
MKRHLRRTSVRVVLVVVSAFGVMLWTVDAVWSSQQPKEVTRMRKETKTFCVGRFLIDVPANAQVSIGKAAIDGFDIINFGAETQDHFAERLKRREEEINAKTNEAGKKNMESILEVHQDHVRGRIFVFGFNSTYGFHGEKKIVYSGVAVNAYVNVAGTTFGFIANDYNPDETGKLTKLLAKFEPLNGRVIPSQPGFCLDGAFLRDPLTADQGERIVMFGGIPGHADMGFVLSTMAGTKRDAESLLVRHAANAAGTFGIMNVLVSTLLNGERDINGLSGEELAFKVRETNFSTGYSFQWEMQGEENNVLRPYVSLELQTGTNPEAGGPPVQSTLSGESLGDLWRRMSSSLRLRPIDTPAHAADTGEQPGLALGTLAWAGQPCQQSGWWQCSDGDAQLGVFGGDRQFLREGATMPQALLLPKPSAWDKVRGVQSSYEARTPTGWRLAEKRVHSRRLPAAGLAEAVTVATAAPTGGDVALAAPGRTLRSAEVCPASGWWRCVDEEALDGTRWFAHGVVLPPATYRCSTGANARLWQQSQLVARQSGWQLMRIADSPMPAIA